MKIVICGDTCFTKANIKQAVSGNAKWIFGDTLPIIRDSDYSICNLESPATDACTARPKSGPNIKMDQKSIRGLAEAGFNAVSLANNHILDYGEAGVKDTIQECEFFGMETFGAGCNSEASKKPCFYCSGTISAGFYSVADNECSIASNDSYGANGYNPYSTLNDIRSASNNCNLLVVLYHSGLEHYQYPSPGLQVRCRAMIDSGAKVVLCQHSHCIGTYEVYQGGLILYGQGNFLFSKNNKDEKWNTGILVELNIMEDSFSWVLHPSHISDGQVELLDYKQASIVLEEIEKRRIEISNPELLVAKWSEFNSRRASIYWGILSRWTKIHFGLDRLANGALSRFAMRSNKTMIIENIVRCESHRESLLWVLSHK